MLGAGLSSASEAVLRAKPIEDIEVGDLVWAWDEVQGTLVKRRVKRLFRRRGRPVLQVVVADSSGVSQIIAATTEHPFWVDGKGWVAAQDLKAGDALKRIDSAPGMQVLRVIDAGGKADVFNFEVDEVHNYFVGSDGVLVHNQSTRPGQTTSTEFDSEAPTLRPEDLGHGRLALPARSSAEYRALVQDVGAQFGRTNGYAVLNTQHLFGQSLGATFTSSWNPAHGPAKIASGTIFAGLEDRVTYSAQSDSVIHGDHRIVGMNSHQNGLLEQVRGWTHGLLSDAFGPDLVVRTRLEGRYTSGPVEQQLWHADGGLSFAALVATEGPGTQVLRRQPVLPPEARPYQFGSSDHEMGVTGPDDFISVPTGKMLVIAGQGLFGLPRQTGFVPTVHRGPFSDAERFLLLVRGYDGTW